QGSGGDMTGLAVQDSVRTSSGSVNVRGSLSTATNWAVGALEVRGGSGGSGGGGTSNGDANGDGRVDGLDYVIWLSNFNTNTTAGASRGDFNGDGTVNGSDYVIWVNFYGQNV